jgi:hypothetical protein
MSNHLVPEQRLDKNGRLNTKHVRATKTQPSSINVPPPTLPADKTASRKKALTAGQKTPKDRSISVSRISREGDLYRHLGMNPYVEEYRVHASDEELYSVLSVASNGDASVLISAGHRSSEDAAAYLREHRFSGHVEDRSAHCAEALDRRITPQRFIDATDYLIKQDSEHYMDAVEVHSTNKQLAVRVQDGAVNFSDIKEIGLKKIKDCKDPVTLVGALQWLATGDASYTASELSDIMDTHPRNFRDALKFTNKYGPEFVLTLHYPNTEYETYLEDRDTNRERIKKLLTFSDQVTQYEIANRIYKEPMSYAKMEKYFDSGLDISHAAEDDCTDQQLDAVKQGVSPGVSGGWL